MDNLSVRDPLKKNNKNKKGGPAPKAKGKGGKGDSDLDVSLQNDKSGPDGANGDGYNDGEGGSDSEQVESLMFESNGFDKDALDEAIEERKKHMLNKHLTKMEKEIYLAIKYGDSNKLRDLGGGE